MKILIVDDESPARQRLHGLLRELGAPYQVAGEAANGLQALQRCSKGDVDLVLMDIRMPEMDGIAAAARLSQLETPPAVVFVTAYEEHALEAFEGNALDYLLKPIRRQRLQKALQRATALTRPQLQALEALQKEEDQHICSNYRGGIQRIAIADIIYFRADQKYVTARHLGGEALLEDTLKSLEQRFSNHLLRIHRNALVSQRRLVGLEKTSDGRILVRLEGVDERLEISRRHLADVRRWLKQGPSPSL